MTFLQVFWLDDSLKRSARAYHDKHINKIIVESAQTICTALREMGVHLDVMYESTHKHSPIVKWLQKSISNIELLYSFMLVMESEAKSRFGRQETHKSINVMNKVFDRIMFDKSYSHSVVTQPPFCADDEFKIEDEDGNVDVIASYRNYYLNDKIYGHKWKTDSLPDWLENCESIQYDEDKGYYVCQEK